MTTGAPNASGPQKKKHPQMDVDIFFWTVLFLLVCGDVSLQCYELKIDLLNLITKIKTNHSNPKIFKESENFNLPNKALDILKTILTLRREL